MPKVFLQCTNMLCARNWSPKVAKGHFWWDASTLRQLQTNAFLLVEQEAMGVECL